jgi:hypothetical protein
MSEREPQKTEDLDVDVGGIDGDAGLDGTSDVGLDESSEFGDSVDDGGLAGLDESGGMGAEREPKQSEESSGGILRTLYGRTLGRVLSTRSLGISFGLTVVFSLLFGLIPLLDIVGKLLGVGVAGFVYGLVASDDRYLETGVAGGLVGGLSAFLGNLLLVSMGSTTRLLAIGTIGGLVLALFGHYFGRDMRDGLTRDV